MNQITGGQGKYTLRTFIDLSKPFDTEGKYTLRTFIDLSKPFDTVNHDTLLEKSKTYGIQSETWNGFKATCQIETVYFVRRF